jgi:voltage-gated potassium channel
MFGQTVADRLRAAGRAVVVVERDESVFERAADTGLAVQGDAREETVLADAGIERASALVAAIDDSNANVQISIVASQLAPDLRLVVRVGDEMYESLAKRAGADEVIIPEVVSGTEASELLSARPGRP